MPLFDRTVSHLPSNLLRDNFGWPPFSVLNTISHDWQRQKREWLYILPHSGEGRDVKRYNATPTNTFSARGEDVKEAESVSIFDPFLCELMYKWFSNKGMKILDPFAGGSVRGLVAETLGRNYVGVDLSTEQVITNRKHQKEYQEKFVDIPGTVEWVCGDSARVLTDPSFIEKYGQFDMVFTCPPYYNLEQYTKNPADLSRMPDYECFKCKYADIITAAADCLLPDTFYCILVTEIRQSPKGLENSGYHGFVPDTIKILMNHGLQYYNEIILENNIGSLPIRAPKYFNQSRKIGRHHQNIVVFYKGNISHIPDKYPALQEQ